MGDTKISARKKQIFGDVFHSLNNRTLSPSPSGRASNLTHMCAAPKVNVRRFLHTNTGTFSEHLVASGAPPLLVITLV
jgi:hypothetical protein